MRVIKISSQRQITLPKSELESLGVDKNGSLILERQNGEMILRPFPDRVVAETAGVLTQYVSPHKKGKPFRTIMEATKRKAAKQMVENGK